MLEELFDWIVGNVPRDTWIAWLNGAAGAGKSAICQSIAEICIQRDIKVASFFFFRADATRNNLDPVIATLAYQVIQLFPEAKDLIIQSIESYPLIFEQAFSTQLDVLVITPIQRLHLSNKISTILLIIDGVDECLGDIHQLDLIRTFGRSLRDRSLPLIVLLGSRRESHIQMAFNAPEIDDVLKQVPLDDNYQAPEDIQHFLAERCLGPTWPAEECVEEIVIKSSGQFIYASVVIKFVSVPSSSPSTRLDIVRGLRPAVRMAPFAELDTLYHHISSQVEDITAALGNRDPCVFHAGHFHLLACNSIFLRH